MLFTMQKTIDSLAQIVIDAKLVVPSYTQHYYCQFKFPCPTFVVLDDNNSKTCFVSPTFTVDPPAYPVPKFSS
jgi:hypothetical protein